jgi:hypothetical protein
MTVDKVGCIDLDSSSYYAAKFASKLADFEDDHHCHEERVLDPHPDPIFISFDDNRFLQDDEMFVSLSGRSRFLLVLAMMLPLSVAFTGLSNHILSPMSHQISSASFSSNGELENARNIAMNRKSLVHNIFSRETSEMKATSEPSPVSNLKGTGWDVSWIIEKSYARYFASVYGMKIINLLRSESLKFETKVSNKYPTIEIPPFVQNIWNHVKLFDKSKKANKQEMISEISDPLFTLVSDSNTSVHKSEGSTAPKHFPLLQRIMTIKLDEFMKPKKEMDENHSDVDIYCDCQEEEDVSNAGLFDRHDKSYGTFLPSFVRYLFTSPRVQSITHTDHKLPPSNKPI